MEFGTQDYSYSGFKPQLNPDKFFMQMAYQTVNNVNIWPCENPSLYGKQLVHAVGPGTVFLKLAILSKQD